MNIQDAMKGFTIYHFFYVGIKSGIFDFICKIKNKGVSVIEISDSLGLNNNYVQIWLNTACAFKYFIYLDNKYFLLDEYSEYILDKDNIKYQGDLICLFIDHLSKDMKTQPDYMKTGKKHLFSDHDKEFMRLISKRGSLRAQTFIKYYIKKHKHIEKLFDDENVICDIGCGTGSFISTLYKTFSKVKYIGIDKDKKSIDIAKSEISSPNINIIHGDISELPFNSRVSCITMILTLHEISQEDRINVLKKCYEHLDLKGKIFIMEFPYPEKSTEFNDKIFSIGTLDQYFEMIWGTKHIGWSEQKKLLEDANFKNIQRKFLDDGFYMIISAEK